MTSRRAASRKSSSSANSASVSPGNPTITFDRTPASARAHRTRASRSRNCSGSPNRLMRRNTVALACWNERSKYGTTPGVDVSVSISDGAHLRGLQVREPHALDAIDSGDLRQQLFEQPNVAEILAVRRRVLTDKTISRTPWSANHRASPRISAGGRDTNAPRNDGIAQNEHRRSQPDASFSGATGPSSRRWRKTLGPPAWPGIPTSATIAGRLTGVTGSSVRRSCGRWGTSGATSQHVVEPVTDRGVVIERQDGCFRQSFSEFAPIALREAADGDHLAARCRIRGHQQRVDGVLLGRLDKAAGIHNGDVSKRRLSELPAGFRHAGRELFGVDVVARATEGHQVD